jgi:two-component system sensor histidine kinase CiaH
MFRRLKLKITLISIAVGGFIILTTYSGVYALTARGLAYQTYPIMHLIAEKVGSGPPDQGDERNYLIFNYFFVRISEAGAITESSSNLPVTEKHLRELVGRTLRIPEETGIADLDQQSYRFLKVSYGGAGETVLVFVNRGPEKTILRHLLVALAIAGLSALTFTFFAGLFMAERALVPIRLSWQRQRDFVADASHELRTPLAVMQTNLELVLGNPDETIESQSRWLNNIHAEGQRMAKLVDDLLLLARADSSQELMEMQYFPLHLALKDALQPFEAVAVSSGIELETSLESEITFYGDEARLKQLAVILVDNAIKYTPPGGRVNIELKDQERNVEIVVSDTGEGIEQKYLKRVFERFYRVDKARSRQTGGNGLGLAIAQWITTEHQGSIKISSGPGKGTTFRVILPKQAP